MDRSIKRLARLFGVFFHMFVDPAHQGMLEAFGHWPAAPCQILFALDAFTIAFILGGNIQQPLGGVITPI